VSYGHTYGSEPQNAVSIIDQRVREMVRQQGLPYSNGSIPQQAVAIPRVTALPKVAQEGDEVFLLIDGGADLYLYLRSIPGWVRVSDTVPSTAPATTFPSDPAEGDTFIYDTGTSGVRWQFVYDTTDGTTYPWLFIGGSAMSSSVATDQSTASTSFADLATTGPDVTLPLAGDYKIEIAAAMYSSIGGEYTLASYDVGGTAAGDDWSANHWSTTNVISHPAYMSYNWTGLSASTLVRAKYRTPSGTANFRNRRLSATPVRVG
jgi:hypothetical protein